jgi:hypothetical protein
MRLRSRSTDSNLRMISVLKRLSTAIVIEIPMATLMLRKSTFCCSVSDASCPSFLRCASSAMSCRTTWTQRKVPTLIDSEKMWHRLLHSVPTIQQLLDQTSSQCVTLWTHYIKPYGLACRTTHGSQHAIPDGETFDNCVAACPGSSKTICSRGSRGSRGSTQPSQLPLAHPA